MQLLREGRKVQQVVYGRDYTLKLDGVILIIIKVNIILI